MSLLTVALAIVLAADPEPASLVARLGTASDAERAAIAARLDALGLKAIGALRAAAGAADPEQRRHASELLEKVERGLLIRPSLVTLGPQDQTIAEAVGAMTAQTGIALVLEPPGDPAWDGLRVRLEGPQPLPFWEALDRISRGARLHHNPAFARGPGERAPVFHLEPGTRPIPMSVSGPFRVGLVSIGRRRALVFHAADDEEPDDPEPDAERFEVLVQVFAEPHLTIALNGPPTALKARDDFDQDLVPPPPVPDDDGDDHNPPARPPSSRIEPGPGPVPGTLSIVQFAIALHAPERPGTTIPRLTGVIPLQVAVRRPDPLTVRLAEAAGRSFETDDMVLRVPQLGPPVTALGPLEVVVRFKAQSDGLTPDDAGPYLGFAGVRPVDTLQQRLEIVDAQQQPLAYRVISVQTDDSGESTVAIGLSGRDARATPVALRVHSLIVGSVEVPFTFQKLPIP